MEALAECLTDALFFPRLERLEVWDVDFRQLRPVVVDQWSRGPAVRSEVLKEVVMDHCVGVPPA